MDLYRRVVYIVEVLDGCPTLFDALRGVSLPLVKLLAQKLSSRVS